MNNKAAPTIMSDIKENITPKNKNKRENAPDILMQHSVATSPSILNDNAARKTLPPSIGNAGIMLKKHMTVFRKNTSIENGTDRSMAGADISIIKKFVKGPAKAIIISDFGVILDMLTIAIPPNGYRVMLFVSILNFFAANECPSSCKNTLINNASSIPPVYVAICIPDLT
jgi:hypothetical protein